MLRRRVLLALALASVPTMGCRATISTPPRTARAARATIEIAHELVGRSVEGRTIEASVMGEGPVTVLVIASIHGDEMAGTWIVRELIERCTDHPQWLDGRRLVAVPVVNPDGVARGTRANARGVDLNRDFPAANQRRPEAAPTEPESRALLELIERIRPDRIVSFHQAASRLDYDGPARELCEAMCAVSPLAVARMGARPGSLGSWAGVDLAIPVVTVELPRAADREPPSRRWELYGEMLLVALRFPDPLSGRPAPTP